MDKDIKVLDEVFIGDISEWMMYRLPEYLTKRFDKWLINPLGKNSVEVFIDVEGEEWELEEDMYEWSLYIALDLLEAYDVETKEGHVIELLSGYALEAIFVNPLSSLGDEPLEEDDRLLFSEGFFD